MSGDTGNTYTIIDAPAGFGNRMVNSDKASLTNSDGVVLMTQSVPYRANSYTLSDTEKVPVPEVTGNIGQVSPYKGAVSYIRMETDPRQTFILRAARENGSTLPFSTKVTDEAASAAGICRTVRAALSEKRAVAVITDHKTDGRRETAVCYPAIRWSHRIKI